MLILAEAGVKDLGDRHITKGERLNCLAVCSHINRRAAFRTDGCATFEINAKIQPLGHG